MDNVDPVSYKNDKDLPKKSIVNTPSIAGADFFLVKLFLIGLFNVSFEF